MEIAQAKHVMTKTPITIASNAAVWEVKAIFEENKIRHLPVLDENGSMEGIISQTDLNRLTFGKFMPGDESFDNAMLDMLTLDDIMIKNPVCVEPETTLDLLIDIFTKGGFHAVPVVEAGELMGIVSTTDLLKYLFAEVYKMKG
jgi:CBS domain-containing protein